MTAARLGRVSLAACVVLPAVCLALGGLSSPDAGWHLASGRWIVGHGAVPHTDPFSYGSAGEPWIDLHWLFQLGLYGIHRVAGVPGIVLARAAAVAATLGLLLWRFGRGAGLWAIAPCVLLLAVVAHHRWLARPDVVSHLILAGQLVLWIDYRAAPRRAWCVVPLQLLWVNLQGTFVLGIVVAGAFAAGELLLLAPVLARRFDRAPLGRAGLQRLAALVAVTAGVSLLNPYGVAGALYPLELWTRISGEHAIYAARIAEFMPPSALGPSSPILLAWLALVGITTAVVAARRLRVDPGLLVLWGLFLFLSLQAIRNLPLSGYVSIALTGLGVQALHAESRRHPGRWLPVTLGVATAVAGLLLARATLSNRVFHALDDPRRIGFAFNERTYPLAATRFLVEQGIPGPIFNDINAGGYLAWSLAPRRSFVDGRLEVHDERLLTYHAALGNPRAFRRLAERYDVNVTLLSPLLAPGLPLLGALARDPDWALVYFDASYSIFVRRSAFPVERVEAWAAAGRAVERAYLESRDRPPDPPPTVVRALRAAGLLDASPEPPYDAGYRAEFFRLIGRRDEALRELRRAQQEGPR
ncbi:MAG: hypothetical protein JRG76_06250 [Deltaproteobacteria bacterium]|nr:hypothetical protein [Deltaproteobacteria bacterium]MBW2414097.1 hypothetical protein [Deltaproteobacteria bacterium]